MVCDPDSTQYIDKDPDAVLDYSINWAEWLGIDTIVTSQWIVPEGIVKESESGTGVATTIWLSGGTTGNQYTVVNRITTSEGRTEDRSLYITVVER